jgi:hypothetical protein
MIIGGGVLSIYFDGCLLKAYQALEVTMNKYIAVLMLLFAPISHACMCVNNTANIIETYNNASAIYLVAIFKIEAINIINGRANLDIDLKVLFTYKGEELGVIKAISGRSFPTKSADGSYQSKATSCDSDFPVGQEYLIAVFGNEEIQLRQCSPNILFMTEGNLGKLTELSTSNRVARGF